MTNLDHLTTLASANGTILEYALDWARHPFIVRALGNGLEFPASYTTKAGHHLDNALYSHVYNRVIVPFPLTPDLPDEHYYIILHELGHAYDPLMKDHKGQTWSESLRLTFEFNAWEWALAHGAHWSPRATCMMMQSLVANMEEMPTISGWYGYVTRVDELQYRSERAERSKGTGVPLPIPIRSVISVQVAEQAARLRALRPVPTPCVSPVVAHTAPQGARQPRY